MISLILFLVDSDFLGEKEIRDIALNMILWSFEETTSYESLCDVPFDSLLLLLNHNCLNTKTEIYLFNVIERWIQADSKARSPYYLKLLKCLRTQSLCSNDFLVMLDSMSVKKNTEVFKYIEALLQEKREQDKQPSNDALKSNKTDNCNKRSSFSKPAVQSISRQVPVVPCVVGRVNPKPNEKFKQNDYITRLLIYRKEEKITQNFIPFENARVHRSFKDESSENLSLQLTEILNSKGYQITSDGPIFYISGGEFVLGRNNWNKYVWRHNTITSKWETICELINVRFVNHYYSIF